MNQKVSIVIVSQGMHDNLKRAIDSVLNQTYRHIELIIVYSGPSNEKLMELVRSYGDSVRFFSKKHESVAQALNFALGTSKGDYFAWLSENDSYIPEKIEKQMAQIAGHDDLIAVSGWAVMNGSDRIVDVHSINRDIEIFPKCSLGFDAQKFNTCAMLFPMATLRNENRFNETYNPARDYRLLESLVNNNAMFKAIDQPLLHYSLHSENVHANDPNIVKDYDRIQSDIVSHLEYDDILGYFHNIENASKYYHKSLMAGRPRTAAFLMKALLSGLLKVGDHEKAREVLLNDLSGLSEEKMGAGADEILSMSQKHSDKKKILFSSAQWLTGGMERVMSILFRELADDYEIFLITPYDERESHIGIPIYVTHIKIDEQHFKKYFDAMIFSYALFLDVDVVIGYINLFDKQLNFYNLCVGTRIKTIASNHEYYFYPYKSPTHYEVVEKRLKAYDNCDAVVWPNSFSASLCGLYVDNNYVIGNPNNFEISTSKDDDPKENIILGVGRFNDYVKRADRMLACFAQVLTEVPDAKLVLVGKHDNDAPYGPGGGQSINNIINELGIPPSRIDFVGEVNNVEDYYKDAKALILTSNSEGFGMVLTEAACFGVPAVCNYMPGIEDVVIDGKNGYVTPQDDIGAMSKRVVNILKDDNLRKRLGSNAKDHVKMFDTKHVGDKWRYLINGIVESDDDRTLRARLSDRLGYMNKDQGALMGVLSQEINETVRAFIENEGDRRQLSKARLVLDKVRKIPRRFKANVEFEGLYNTLKKIVIRTYRLLRRVLKI